MVFGGVLPPVGERVKSENLNPTLAQGTESTETAAFLKSPFWLLLVKLRLARDISSSDNIQNEQPIEKILLSCLDGEKHLLKGLSHEN